MGYQNSVEHKAAHAVGVYVVFYIYVRPVGWAGFILQGHFLYLLLDQSLSWLCSKSQDFSQEPRTSTHTATLLPVSLCVSCLVEWDTVWICVWHLICLHQSNYSCRFLCASQSALSLSPLFSLKYLFSTTLENFLSWKFGMQMFFFSRND